LFLDIETYALPNSKARSNVEYFFEIKFKQKSDNVVSVSMKRSDAGWIFIEKAYIALNKCDIKK
jgi:hypothetical protein